ncbi:MAG: hypothetical protein GY950_04400 [bacterium]|nr:hypothetical protein [bacterium]
MKKTILIILAVLLTAGLLLNTGCKKKHRFDITGGWFITVTIDGQSFEETYEFVGNEEYGAVYWEGQELGSYSVTDDLVDFTLSYYDVDDDYTTEVYQGSFDSDYQMSGTGTFSVEGYETVTGIWLAVRGQ